ncbi:MAG: hypothetical protein U0T69_04810 [Chitinophagales bacterium]
MSNKTDILNELKEISPLLLQIKENEKPLVIPADYFLQLADNLMLEIKSESDLLASIKKEKTEVPENYFDTFGDTIISKIKEQETIIERGKIIELPKQEHKIFTLFKRVALAASIVVAVIFVKQVQQPDLPVNDCGNGIACLTQDEIYQYMNANAQDFEVQQIQEAVKPALEKQETKIEMNEKEIEKYIQENNNIIEAEDASTDIF